MHDNQTFPLSQNSQSRTSADPASHMMPIDAVVCERTPVNPMPCTLFPVPNLITAYSPSALNVYDRGDVVVSCATSCNAAVRGVIVSGAGAPRVSFAPYREVLWNGGCGEIDEVSYPTVNPARSDIPSATDAPTFVGREIMCCFEDILTHPGITRILSSSFACLTA